MQKLTPFSPLMSAQLPGGSQILDRNLLALKKSFDSINQQVNQLTTIININVTGGQQFAPIDATYIVQTPSAVLTNEQALSLLPTGLLKVTTGTGVLSTAVVGIDYQAAITWPIAGEVLVSTGTGTTPAGDAKILIDTTQHELQLQPGSDLASFNLFNSGGANFEGVLATWSANRFFLHSEASGTGTVRPMTIASTAGLTVDAYLQINGATAPTNASLVVGHATNADRDRVQFFVGGGALQATGANDNTFVDVTPSSSTMTLGLGVAGGIYATERIRGAAFTGGGLGSSVVVGASLYVDAAPSFVVQAGARYAIYVAAGNVHLGAALDVTGGASSATLTTLGAAGTVFAADGNGPTIAFFAAAGAPQQVGGAAAAGAAYTAVEQGMINRMYGALRTYGLLT
jgi:hypothetical protein